MKPRLWPFAALSAGYFAHIGFFNPYLPLWLKDMGFGLLAISLMTSLQSATRLFAPYLWGWLSDHVGSRVLWLRYCATVALLVSLGLLLPWSSASGVGLFCVLLLLFTHTSGMMPLSEAALAQSVSQHGGFDAHRYGRIRLWGSLGFLVTVLAAGAWFERHSMASFPLWSALTLLAVVVSVWTMPDPRDAAHAGHEPVRVWPVLRQPAVAWFFVAAFFHVLAHVFIYIFFSLYLDELGYTKSSIGWLWAVAVIVEIAWFFTQGRWLQRWTLPRWLTWVSALMTLRMALTAGWAEHDWVLCLAQLAHAFTFAAHHSVCMAWLNKHFPGRLVGRGQALYAVLCYGLSGVVAGLVGGASSVQWGVNSVFWLATGAALLGTCASLMVGRSHQ